LIGNAIRAHGSKLANGLFCVRMVVLIRKLQSIVVENQALLGFIDGGS